MSLSHVLSFALECLRPFSVKSRTQLSSSMTMTTGTSLQSFESKAEILLSVSYGIALQKFERDESAFEGVRKLISSYVLCCMWFKRPVPDIFIASKTSSGSIIQGTPLTEYPAGPKLQSEVPDFLKVLDSAIEYLKTEDLKLTVTVGLSCPLLTMLLISFWTDSSGDKLVGSSKHLQLFSWPASWVGPWFALPCTWSVYAQALQPLCSIVLSIFHRYLFPTDPDSHSLIKYTILFALATYCLLQWCFPCWANTLFCLVHATKAVIITH